MRKLATIQKIEEILPIEGADAIEKVRIKGWWCVAKKGEFKPGDLCLYFEVDSLLPEIPQFSFMAKGNKLKESFLLNPDTGAVLSKPVGWRLRTVVLRGQVSQGLALPLSAFPGVTVRELEADISKQLGIYKYERPIPPDWVGKMKGAFPGFIPKTDEERIQSDLSFLEKYRGQRFYKTSKLDGESATAFKDDSQFGICAHEFEFLDNADVDICKLFRQYSLKEKLPNGYAIQAEAVGEGFESNRLDLKGADLYVFYVFDIANWQYLKLEDMKRFVKDLGMKTVPIVDDNFILNHTYEQLLEMANTPSPLNPQRPQEGHVYRLYDSTEKISFKVISNKYLVKWGL